MAFEDQEYHRRRSEIELEVAVSALDEASAQAHFQLARLHRARRHIVAKRCVDEIRARFGGSSICIDKEA